MSDETEGPYIVYGARDDEFGGATFLRVCPRCNRFVKADARVRLDGQGQPTGEANATCSRHVRVEMEFEGYL